MIVRFIIFVVHRNIHVEHTSGTIQYFSGALIDSVEPHSARGELMIFWAAVWALEGVCQEVDGEGHASSEKVDSVSDTLPPYPLGLPVWREVPNHRDPFGPHEGRRGPQACEVPLSVPVRTKFHPQGARESLFRIFLKRFLFDQFIGRKEIVLEK